MASDESGGAPVRANDEEWANALTHGLAAVAAVVLGWWLVSQSAGQERGLAMACGLYSLSVFATFCCSTLSHTILRQPLLDTFRAWDQAMIYAMISGTYTPIVYGFCTAWYA